MIFAQLDLPPSSSTGDLQTSNLLGFSVWWLLGLTVVVVFVIGILSRRHSKQPVSNTSGIGKPSRPSLQTQPEASSLGKPRPIQAKKKNKNQKKKKSVSNRAFTLAAKTETTVSVPASHETKNQDLVTPAAIAETAHPKATTPNPTTVVEPIFAPLSHVGSLRRVSVPTVEKAGKSSGKNEDEDDNRFPIVPFEKIKKPSDAVRSSTNRWANLIPAAPSKPVVSQTKRAIEMPLPASVELDPKLPESSTPKGLKGFVSKVKSANATASDSEPNP